MAQNSDTIVDPFCGYENELAALCECGRLFHQRGWSVGTSSNYSVVVGRQPTELIVTASGFDKGHLNGNEFVRIDASGQPTLPTDLKASAEAMLHVVLAERGEAGAILHTHSIWGTLLSDFHFADGGFEISGYEMLKGLSGFTSHEQTLWMPIYENTQDIATLAEQIRQDLGSDPKRLTHGFLIRNHGLYTWGSDLFVARRQIEVLEFLFEVVGRKTNFSSGPK